jgi:hypothetical protein
MDCPVSKGSSNDPQNIVNLACVDLLAAVCGVQPCADQPNAASEHSQPSFGAL